MLTEPAKKLLEMLKKEGPIMVPKDWSFTEELLATGEVIATPTNNKAVVTLRVVVSNSTTPEN